MHYDKELHQLITEIYNLVLEPDEWENVLDKLVFYCDSIGINLFTQDKCHPEISKHYFSSIFTSNIETLNRYLQKYGDAERYGWSNILCKPPQHWCKPEETYDPKLLPELKKFWKEELGIHHAFGTSISSGIHAADGFAFNFTEDLKNLEKSKSTASFYIPHLAKVFEIQRPFNLLRERFSALFSALDKIKIGVCILNKNHEVILNNEHASDLLSSTEGIWLGRGNKICSDPDDFSQAIKKYSERIIKNPSAASSRYTVIAESTHLSRYGLLAEIMPLHDLKGQLEANMVGSIVYLIDPNRDMEVRTDLLADLCGLTRAEVDVSRQLVNGKSMKEISEHRNTSVETVKSQAKNIYQKTNCSDRIELLQFAHKIYLPVKN